MYLLYFKERERLNSVFPEGHVGNDIKKVMNHWFTPTNNLSLVQSKHSYNHNKSTRTRKLCYNRLTILWHILSLEMTMTN